MTTPNAELAHKVLDHIDAHPEQWRQIDWISRPDGWDCGTSACFAGWTCLLSGDQPLWEFTMDESTSEVITPDGPQYVNDRAANLLGIDEFTAKNLFMAENARHDLRRKVAAIFGPRPGGKS